MRNIIAAILLGVVIFLTTYGLIKEENGVIPYIQLFLGVLFLLWGTKELQEKKWLGVLFIIVSGLSFYISISHFLS